MQPLTVLILLNLSISLSDCSTTLFPLNAPSQEILFLAGQQQPGQGMTTSYNNLNLFIGYL